MHVPPDFTAQRQAVADRIRAAFHGVTRDGGISWSEAGVIDEAWGDGPRQAESRRRDSEGGWEELVDSPSWSPDAGMGGFSFLDPIGFRYSIAPAMLRRLRESDPCGLEHHLCGYGKFIRSKYEHFTAEQSRAVAGFLGLMVAQRRALGFEPDPIFTDAVEFWEARSAGTH